MPKRLPDKWGYIGKELSAVKAGWDQEELWGEIEKQLPHKKRRFLPFIIVLALAACLGADTFSYPTKKTPSNISSKIVHLSTQSKKKQYPPKKLSPILNANITQNQFVLPLNSLPQAIVTEVKSISNAEKKSVSRKTLPINSIQITAPSFQPRIKALPSRKLDSFPINFEAYYKLEQWRIDPPILLSKWYIEAYAGIAYANRKFRARNENYGRYLEERARYESPLESIETGFLLGINLLPKWDLQLGLEFQQITERLQWQNSQTDSYSVNSDSAFFFVDQLNNLQYVPGTLEGTRTTLRKISYYNRYQLYNLPLFLNYRYQARSFGGQMRLGGILNLQQQYAGRFLDLESQLLEASTTKASYRTQIGWMWQVSLGLSYNPRPNQSWIMEGTYRSTANFSADPNYEQSYQLMGLRLGWRLYLH